MPIPWRGRRAPYGFGDGGTWLPQPESFARLARDVQAASPSSHLSLYKRMLELRRRLDLGRGSLSWYEDLCTDTSLAFLNGSTLVLLNVGSEPLELPPGGCCCAVRRPRVGATTPGTWPAPAIR